MELEIINVDTTSEIRREHVCFYVVNTGDLRLYEVCTVYYKHPDGPCLIPRIETREVMSTYYNDPRYPEILLLYLQQLSTRKIHVGVSYR